MQLPIYRNHDFDSNLYGGLGMDEAYRNLWIAVLKQAIKDMERSRPWFEDGNKETGSFQWICSVLDLNPRSIKRLIIYKGEKEFQLR